jgi:hypothetical protein
MKTGLHWKNLEWGVFYDSWFAKAILWAGYGTIMFLLMIFTKSEKLSITTLVHENTHRAQYLECAIVGAVIAAVIAIFLPSWWLILIPILLWYFMYGLEYAVSWVFHLFVEHPKEQHCEYASSAMEMEAKDNENNQNYLMERPWFAFLKYYGRICGYQKK